MKDMFRHDQKARPNNIPQRYMEYISINVGITKFNDNAAITGLLGYREGNKGTLKLTKYISGRVTRTQNFTRPTLLF